MESTGVTLSNDTLQELARQIVSRQVIDTWPYWLALAFLMLIVAAAVAWATSYFKIRGENLANKTDFDDLLDQLRKQTDATEKIRASVSQAMWLSQEWNRLRRTKLEEYLAEVSATPDRLEAWHHIPVYGASLMPPGESPLARAEMLQSLYFPELKRAQLALAVAAINYRRWGIAVLNSRLSRLPPGGGLAHLANIPPTDEDMAPYSAHYAAVTTAVSAIQQEAAIVLSALVRVSEANERESIASGA